MKNSRTQMGGTMVPWTDKPDTEDLGRGTSPATFGALLLLQPAGGFTGNVTEVGFLCFYNSGICTPSLGLPPGC
jgi:hypothetical protein